MVASYHVIMAYRETAMDVWGERKDCAAINGMSCSAGAGLSIQATPAAQLKLHEDVALAFL